MKSLWSTWLATARRHPRKVVVAEADTGRSWTCAELTAAAERAANPVWRGRVVAFSLPNGADWFIRFLAVQRAGGIAAPLDPSLAGEPLVRATQSLSALRVRPNVCCLKLTSGTTGELQPIACTAAHLLADGRHVTRTMGIRATDRNLAVIPLGHSYGLGNLVLPLLMHATPVVCTQSLLPRHLLQLIDIHRITVLPIVPAVLRALAQTEGVAKPDPLRLVISAGAPLSTEVAQQFFRRFGLKIHNFYGASETGGICYDRTGTATLSGRSVGKPLHGVTVRIRKDSRIAVSSPAGRATLPDLGGWNRYGELRLLGRVGQIANIGGKKVFPAEVELCLRNVAGVTDAWVCVRQDRRGNDYLAVAVETARPQDELERELARHLPAWKLPRQYLLRPSLPRTGRGKLDTAALRKLQPATQN